jgi:hypothetical protein
MKVPFFQITLLTIGALFLMAVLFLADFSGSFTLPQKIGSSGEEKTSQNLNVFNKIESPDGYDLTYGWKNFSGDPFQIDFFVSKKVLEEAEKEFGFRYEELDEVLGKKQEQEKIELIKILKEYAEKEISRSKYAEYIRVDENALESFKLKVSAPPSVRKEVKAEFDKITAKVLKKKDSEMKKVEKNLKKEKKEFLHSRGLRYIGDKIGVNYGLCVKKNKPRVKHVVDRMKAALKKVSLLKLLDLMLAFVQEIRYGIPPLSEEKKMILEFWVPLKVLVNNFGDCDSKGVTFASMWTNYKKYPLIIIRIPNHLFLGLGIPSPSSDAIIVNGIRYILCEVTGPDKIPPGLITPYSRLYLEGGKYQYEMIR